MPSGALRTERDRGRWVVEATAGSVVVLSSAQPLQVSCTLQAAPPGTARLSSGQSPPSEGRTAAGAMIGGGVGAVATAPAMALGGPFGFLAATVVLIGAVSGARLARTADAAAQTFRYPDVVTVTMVCPALAPRVRAEGAGLRVGDLLLAVDGRPLPGTLDLEDALRAVWRRARR